MYKRMIWNIKYILIGIVVATAMVYMLQNYSGAISPREAFLGISLGALITFVVLDELVALHNDTKKDEKG